MDAGGDTANRCPTNVDLVKSDLQLTPIYTLKCTDVQPGLTTYGAADLPDFGPDPTGVPTIKPSQLYVVTKSEST